MALLLSLGCDHTRILASQVVSFKESRVSLLTRSVNLPERSRQLAAGGRSRHAPLSARDPATVGRRMTSGFLRDCRKTAERPILLGCMNLAGFPNSKQAAFNRIPDCYLRAAEQC